MNRAFEIGLNNLSFHSISAHLSLSTPQTRIRVIHAVELEEIYQQYLQEIAILAEHSNDELATSLLVFPHQLPDFDLLDFLSACEYALEEQGLAEYFQIAPFHPDFQFADDDTDDQTSVFTNKSPYPIFHLLRADEVEKVLKSPDVAEQIVKRNKTTLAQMGISQLHTLFNSIKS